MTKKSSKKAEILHRAMVLARTGGVEAVTARAVCQAAGVTAPTLYYHFGDQQGLREAIVTAAFQAALAKTSTERDEDPTREIARGWDAYVAFAMTEPRIFAIMNASIVSDRVPDIALGALATLESEFEKLTSVQLAGRLPGDLAIATWSAAHGVATMAAAAALGGLEFDEAAQATVRDAVLSRII